MQIVQIDPRALTPYRYNSRKHSDGQIDRIGRSLQEFGFTNPVLVDSQNVIVAGHARVQAAIKLNMATVPTISLVNLTPAQIRAYVVADNRLAELSEWDQDILASELAAIKIDFDLELIGFENFKFTTDDGEDDFEEPESVTTDLVLGDLIQIGDHRLMCGDSTNPQHVAELLNGKEPYLMITDPPYGVEYDAKWRTTQGLQKTGAHGKVMNDDVVDWSDAWSLSPAKVAYVYHAGKFTGEVKKSLEDNLFLIRSQIIWVKNQLVIGRGDYHWKHKPCWYAVKKGSKGNWAGDRKQTTIWEIDKPQKSETGHSTQKPIECMARAMRNHDGDVYEPFAGSGTTMVAAHQLERKCYAMELSPEYCQIIVDRMHKLDPALLIFINGELRE